MFGFGEKKQDEAQEGPQPPNETGVRMKNAMRRAVIWGAIGAAVILGLGLVGGFMAGGAILSSGPLGWLAAAVGLKSGAAASAGAAVLPYVLGAVGVVAGVGGILGFSDDKAVQTANDEFERTQQQAQLGQLEKQRMAIALQKQKAENEKHMAARGTMSGDMGAFLPPSLPFGGSGGGGGRNRAT